MYIHSDIPCSLPTLKIFGPLVLMKKIFEGFYHTCIYGRGGHHGHVTWIIYINFRFASPWRLHMEFGFYSPTGLNEDLTKDDGRQRMLKL